MKISRVVTTGVYVWLVIVALVEMASACHYNLGNNQFNLGPLKKEQGDYSLELAYGKVSRSLKFNLCQEKPQFERCQDSFGDCNSLAHNKKDKIHAQYLNENNHTEGVSLIYPDGAKCVYSDDNKAYKFRIDLVCDPAVTGLPQYSLSRDSLFDPCNPVVVMKSIHACPALRVPEIWFRLDNSFINFVLIMLGIFLATASTQYFKATSFITMMASAALVVYMICSSFMKEFPIESNHDKTMQLVPYCEYSFISWTILLLSLLVGALFAKQSIDYVEVVKVLSGVWAGFMLSIMLYAYLNHFPLVTKIQWLFSLTLMALGGYANKHIFPKIYTISNCIIGSYLITRGLGSILGGFPNEFILYEARVEDRYIQYGGPLISPMNFGKLQFIVSWTIYLYANIFVIMTCIAAICHYKFGFKLAIQKKDKEGNQYEFSLP